MRRLLPILLAVALFVPGAAFAKSKKAKAKANIPEWAVESEKCSGDRDVKSVSLGKERVYLNANLNSVSFAADEVHTFKHDLYYSCMKCDQHKRTPGSCGCGGDLTPSFKHGDTWFAVGYNNGVAVVEGAPPPDQYIAPAGDHPMYQEHPKKAKKGKKGKKGKKAKKAKTEEAPAAPAEPAPADKK